MSEVVVLLTAIEVAPSSDCENACASVPVTLALKRGPIENPAPSETDRLVLVENVLSRAVLVPIRVLLL
jgi:hypothetical protein